LKNKQFLRLVFVNLPSSVDCLFELLAFAARCKLGMSPQPSYSCFRRRSPESANQAFRARWHQHHFM